MVGKPDCWIGLIRAIGGGTHTRMSMTRLREACEGCGFQDVRTVLATGNVVFRSPLPEAKIHRRLAKIIAAHGLDNDVFLRSPADLRQVLEADPFPDAATDRPGSLLVMFMQPPPDAAAEALPNGYERPERLRLIGRDAYIDYADTIGQSRLTPTRLEWHFGQPGTARNWNTIHKLLAGLCGWIGRLWHRLATPQSRKHAVPGHQALRNRSGIATIGVLPA